MVATPLSAIGLDVGTSRVKAVRFDDSWSAVDTEAEATSVLRTAEGGREQSLDEVWAAAARVISRVAARSPEPIDFVALTAQGDGCWLIDDAGRPVRPAMLWNDNRAADLVAGWVADGTAEQAFRISGCSAAPGLANAELRWLSEHEPEVLSRARTLLTCGSWVYFRLTGRRIFDTSDAANPFFAARARRYDARLLDLAGIPELGRLLPDAVTGADRVGRLSPEVADLGIPAGTPVVLAPYDVMATAIGTGTTRPGDAFAVLGTTLCVGTVRDDPMLDRPPNGITLPGVRDDRWLIAYPTASGTEVLDWTATVLGLPDAKAVTKLAAASAHHAPPLLLPYLSPSGERSPFVDTNARGTFVGLELGHQPADVARGVLDGLTLAVLDCLVASGMPGRLALAGGGARSDLWAQAICDAAGVPVVRPEVTEVGALGAVLSAAADLGVVADLDETASRCGVGASYTPNPVETERFSRRYDELLDQRKRLLGH